MSKFQVKEYFKAYYLKNREKKLQYSKDRYRKSPEAKSAYDKKRTQEMRRSDPDRVRKKALRNRYGITLEQYKMLVEQQDHRCLICKAHRSYLSRDLVVDHCHKTKKIRGLLCNLCNLGLGYFKDNDKNLRSAIEYLKNNS